MKNFVNVFERGLLNVERKEKWWKATCLVSIALNILFIVVLLSIRQVNKHIDFLYLEEGHTITINADTDSIVIGRYRNGNLAVRINGREIK